MKLVDAAFRASIDALLWLALSEGERPVALAVLARRTGTSISYLEQLFGALRAAGLVQAVRGPGGGYLLNGRAESISAARIVSAVSRMRPRNVAADTGSVPEPPGRIATQVWADCEAHAMRWLDGVTLADLLQWRGSATPAQAPTPGTVQAEPEPGPTLCPEPAVPRHPAVSGKPPANSVFAYAGRFSARSSGT